MIILTQFFVVFICLTILLYLIFDYYGPSEISLVEEIGGLASHKAKDLVVQGYDDKGNLWATRGMIAYQLSKNNKFIRKYHIPTGLSIFWVRNFSIIRQLTIRSECVELLPMSDGEACVMSAGHMWYRSAKGKNFKKTFTLPHYGKGIGLGIRNDGLTRLDDGTILFGEYFINKNRTNVRVFISNNNGKSWKIAYDFKPGRIKHIHAIQKDPYTNKIWICTGDLNKESMIAWSNDYGTTLNPIGQGDQRWRVTQLVFTKNAIYWGVDAGEENATGIYKWDRSTYELTNIIKFPKETFYGTRLTEGTIVLSTNSLKGINRKAFLEILTHDDNVSTLEIGTKKSNKTFTKLRFPREQNGSSLYITCLNLREYSEADLIVIPEEKLKSIANNI